MAPRPSDVQPQVAVPISLTDQELQTAMSTPTIQQRIADVNAIARTILNVDHSDPVALTKAFEMFQISTHNIDNIGHQNPQEMGTLFSAAQMSLQYLQACVLTRLGCTTDDIDIDELDKEYPTLGSRCVEFKRYENMAQ